MRSDSFHANIHFLKGSERVHYCLISNYARSEGGKSFKRKNEMIRHDLIYKSPDYVCSFCPESEKKVSETGQPFKIHFTLCAGSTLLTGPIRRHVRVNHSDKDENDPQLREILAQRVGVSSLDKRKRLIS